MAQATAARKNNSFYEALSGFKERRYIGIEILANEFDPEKTSVIFKHNGLQLLFNVTHCEGRDLTESIHAVKSLFAEFPHIEVVGLYSRLDLPQVVDKTRHIPIDYTNPFNGTEMQVRPMYFGTGTYYTPNRVRFPRNKKK